MTRVLNISLFVVFSLFVGVTTASACGGGNKTHTKYHKGKAAVTCASAKCMDHGTCTDPSCSKNGKCTMGTASKSSKSECSKAHHACMDHSDKS